MKHRLLCLLLCCVFLFSMAIPAHATETTEYQFDDPELTISLPNRFTEIVTPETDDPSDPILTEGADLFGFDPDSKQAFFLIFENPGYSIDGDFNLRSDEEIFRYWEPYAIDQGDNTKLIKSEIYHHSQTKFYRAYTYLPSRNPSFYSLDYYTVYAGNTITLSFQSSFGKFTPNQEKEIQNIVDSIQFPSTPEPLNYRLDELGMTISFPYYFDVATRKTNETMTSYEDVYLNALNPDINQGITVFMYEDHNFNDFNLYSDASFSELIPTFSKEYGIDEDKVLKSELYLHPQSKFIKTHSDHSDETGIIFSQNYVTVYGGKLIDILLCSYGEDISPELDATMQSIVDSIQFDDIPISEPSEQTSSNSFTYTDPQTQISFTIPKNWEETPLSKERTIIKKKYTSLVNPVMIMMYGTLDLWNEMSVSERSGYVRSEIDNSSITKEDIADAWDADPNDIQLVTYGDHEYYTATLSSDAELSGLNFTYSMTHMLLVKNGYLYLFQFSGDTSNELYKDFEALLSSVTVNNIDTQGSTTPDNETLQSNVLASTDHFDFLQIMIILLITIVIYSLPILLYRYAICRAPVDKKAAITITVFYGIIALVIVLILMLFIHGIGILCAAIVLWSLVNYCILIGGTKKHPLDTPPQFVAAKEPEIPIVPEIDAPPQEDPIEEISVQPPCSPADNTPLFCHKCGTKLPPDSLFCSKCGTQIPLNH